MAPYKLKTFGAVSLCSTTDGLECKVGKSKLVLLAVIAASGSTGIPRERIASLFWPESDSDRSRNSLNQSLFALRRSVADVSLVTGSDILTLNAPDCEVDFLEFEKAMSVGDVERAIALRAKPFLDGVRLSANNELERWIENKRDALETLYSKGLRCAFDNARASSDPEKVLAVAKKRVELSPYDADAAGALVQAHCEAGDLELAQRHVVLYEKLVRQDLEIDPDPRVAAIAERTRKKQEVALRQPETAASSEIAPLPAEVTRAPTKRGFESRRIYIAGMSVTVLLAVFAFTSWRLFRTDEAVGSSVETIAILPFCINGADEPELSNGMVDLLGASLPGDAGPRPLDSHATISAANRKDVPCKLSEPQAREVASKLGAQRFVLGGAVISGENLVLSARIGRVSGNAASTRTVDARGTLPNLHEVVGQLSNKIQAVLINEPDRRLPDILARSTPALRAYLHGRALWRSGQKTAAVNEYITALDADSTFALAGYALAEAGGWAWGGEFENARRHLVRVSATPARLSGRDKALLDAILGNPPHRLSSTEALEGWERAVDLAPDSPTAWYEYGDRLYHIGAATGRQNPIANAKAAFDKAVSLDSSYTIPLGHLVEIAINANDSAATRKYQKLYEAAGPYADYRQFIEWRIANFFHDQEKRAALIASIGEIPTASLHRIAGLSQFENIDLPFGMMALRELERRSGSPMWKFDVAVRLHDRAINDHNWKMAESAIHQIELNSVARGYLTDVVTADALRLTDVLFGGADSAQILPVLERLELSTMFQPRDDADRPRFLGENCVLGIWYGRRGGTKAKKFLQRIRALRPVAGEAASRYPADPALCNAMVDAELAVQSGAAGVAAVSRLDSIAMVGLDTFGNTVANMETARLYYSIGKSEDALRAVRRRRYEWTEAVRYLSASRSLEAKILSSLTLRK